MTKSLWGDLPKFDNIKSPKDLLVEQAEELVRLTDGLLRADVRQVPPGMLNPKEISIPRANIGSSSLSTGFFSSGPDELAFVFVIVAPKLRGYEYELLKVKHGATLFPLKLVDFVNEQRHEIANTEGLEKILASILQSDEVHNVLRMLIIQSR